MKKIYFLFLFTILLSKGFTQNCISLGCAAAYSGIVTNDTLPLTLAGPELGCYNTNKYEQIYWQFFYSPTGGNFTQTYTPTSNTNLALNYVIFDAGITPPAITCPVNSAGFSQIACFLDDSFNIAVGPGLAGVTATTVTGHYYAVAVIVWQDSASYSHASYTFDISVPQIGGLNVTPANCPGVLPVTLSSFDAKVNNCKVNLNWTAAAQTNLKNYEVQAGIDGKKFGTVAVIPSKGALTNQSYSYTHTNSALGNVYYRLKINDVDGNFKYSKIVPVSLGCSGNHISVYPNPVSNILNINIANLQNDITIGKLFDNGGKLIYSAQLKNGDNSIDMTKFSKGVYLLRLKNSAEVQNIKVVK